MGWKERQEQAQQRLDERYGLTSWEERKQAAQAAGIIRRPVEPEVGAWDTSLTRRTQSAINPAAVTDPLYDAALRKAEEEQKQEQERAKWYDVIGTDLMSGIARSNASLMSGLTYFTGQEYSPFKKLSDYYNEQSDIWENNSQSNYETRGNDILSRSSDFVTKTVGQAIPDTVYSLASATSKAAKGAADIANYGKTAVQKTIESLAKSPSFWNTFVKEGGEQGQRALEDGANPFVAAMSAVGTGIGNGAIEIGSGIEGKAGELPTWKNLLRSSAEEGGEEVAQGALSNLIAKAAYDIDAPFFSIKDDTAVINPVRAAQEFAGGAIAGGIMSAPRTAAYSISSRMRNGKNLNNTFQSEDSQQNVKTERISTNFGENGEKQYNAQLKRRQSAQGGTVQQGNFEQEFGYYYRAGKDDVPYDKVPEYAGERSMDDVARAGAYYSGQNDMQAEADTLGTETNARRFYENVDKVFKGEISEREVIKIGKTPQILQDYGAKDLPITINQSTMYKIAYPKDYFGAKDQGHNLGIPSLKRLPSQIADPVAILKSKSQDNSLVLLTAWKDTNKYPVIVPLHLDKNSIIGMSNDIVSAYGKQNFNALLTDEKGNSTVLYTKNNEDIHQLLQSGLQLPGVVSDDTLINKIISQDGGKVNNIVNWDINGAKGSGEYIGTVENNGKRFARVKMQNGKTADIDMAFVSDVDNVDNVVADTKNVPSDTKNVYSDTENGVSDTEKAVSKSESKTSTTEKTASAAKRNISPRVTKKEREFFDKLSKAINTPIEFVDSIKSPSGQAANGAYVNGKIILAEDSDRPLIEVAKHEITHMLKENAPKEYAAYESYAIEALKKNGRYDDLYREYSELYGTDNESAINEELAADATQMFLTDEAAINELAQENPGLAKKFLDCIRGFIEKIKSLFADGGIDEVTASFETEQLKNAEKLWIKAIAAAEQGQSGNNKNGGNVNSETKFSLKKPVEETKDLIAVHNLTPEKLKGILELGGFPVPSIAIIKADMEHSGYGDISVLFGKDTIDPESDSRNDVFSADAYTSRFPQIDIKLKNGELKKIADRLNTSVSMLEANEFSRSTKEDIISDLKGNRNARETFLKENDIKVEPVLRMPEYTKSVHKRKAVSDFIARKDVTFEKLVNDDTVREEYMSAIKTAFGERKSMSGVPLAEKWCTMITETLDKCKNDRFLFEAEEKRFNTDKSIADNTAVPVEDAYSYIDGVDNAISDYGAEFDVWLNELVEPAIGEKYVRKDIEAYKNNGDRRSFKEMHDEYTLENIVKNMSRGTNNESGFGPAGIGELRAATSTRFGSIGDVRAAKSKIQNLTDEQIQNIYEAATEKLSEVSSELYKYQQYKSGNDFIDLDNVGETIKDAFVQYTDENDVIEYLKEYYPKAPKSTFDMVIDLKKTLENLPVKYFEAKPHRAIGFDEVKAVVVPDDIDLSLKQELNNAGLNVIEYEKGNSRSRVDAVNSVDDIKFQLRRQESLERQNEKLRVINDSLREQFYLTEGIKVNRKQIDTAARKFLADIHSKADKSEFSERLAGIYDTLANSNYDNEAYTAAMYELEKLTSDALHKSETIDDTLYKQYADLREHIRTTGITANESAKSDFGSKEDWNDFRKSNFGRIKIVNDGLPVDVFYKELSEMYPEWFSDDVQTQSDQLIRIANVLDGIKPVYENPYLMDIDEMSKTAAYELFTEFFGMGDQTTFADRKQAQMNNLKIKTKSQIAGLRQEYKTRNTKNILAQREKYQEHIRKLIDERDEKIKEIKLADSMHYGAEIANLKRTYNDKMKGQAEHYKGRISDTIARKNEKIEEVRQYYQERIDRLKTLKNARIALEHDRYTQYKEKTKERAAVREFKKKIKKDWYALSDMLLKPTDKKHIPEKMRDAIANVLNTIDIRSGFKNKDGTDTKVALKLNNLYDKFKSFEQNPDTESMLEVMNPDFFANFEELKKSFNGNEITIQDMTSKQLEQVAGIIRDVKHCVQNANRSFADKQKRDISEIVKAIISDLRTKGVRVDKGKFDWSSDVKGKFKDIEFGMLTPYSFFHQLGENAEGIYWQMRKGLNEKVRMVKTATDYFADIKKRYKINIKNISGKKAERINFTVESGEKISMNKAEIMSLYLLNKREQGQKHIYGGGITLEPEIMYVKEGKKKVAKIKAEKRPVQVTERDVRNITGTLSENERAFADMLGKFLSEDCSEWGNEVSMKLYGYKKFVEQFYFPLNSDKNYLIERFNNADDIASIKNMGFTKQTNAFANNPVIISDVFDVFCRHVDDMSTYGALALPVNDFQRIYNFKDKSVSLKGEIESAYGAAAKKYITDFMRSVNGMSTKSMTGTLPSKLVGNVKAAAVGWNLRVVIQQPTAILRATSMIDAKYFVQNVKNISVEEMQKHSAIALYKSWGNYSLDMGRQVKEVITDEFSVADKIKEAGMWGAGKADDVTWSVIFNAVKNEIADTRKDLSVGSKAYWEAVEDRFDHVIDETQVVDSVFHRSALMRNEDGLVRQIMSFMGEPTQSYNMIRRSAYDLYKNATPENKRKVLRAVSAFAVTTVVNSAIKSIVDSIRDDDDEKNFLEKWFKYFISGLWQEPFSMIPIVKDIVSIAQGYNVDRMDMSGIADIISSVTRAIKGGQTAGYSGFDIILSAVNASGIGAKNMFRELKSVEKMIIGSAEKVGADTDWIEYNLLKAKFNINNSKNRTKFYAQLYEAYDKGMEKGDLSTAKRILEDMVLHGIPVSGAVRNLDSRDKKALSKDKELVKIVEKAKTDKTAAVGMLSEFEKKNEGRYDDKIVEAAIKMIQKGISDINYTPEDIYKTKQTNPEKALEMYYTLIELGFYKREDLDIALEIIKRRKARQ